MRVRKILVGGLILLIISLSACGPVNQTVRPDGGQLDSIKKLAVVMPAEGEFTVIYERAKATATPAVMFGLIGAAVASAHNKSQDEELARSFGNQLNGFSSRSIFLESFKKTLLDSNRFPDIKFFDKKDDLEDFSRYDAVLTFHMPSWGIRIVERGQSELLAAFIELEAKMSRGSVTQLIWDEQDTVIGQSKRSLSLYQNEKGLCAKDMYGTAEDAGQRMANILIYR